MVEVEIKRVVEADRLKIPYRVAIYIGQSLDKLDMKNDNDLDAFLNKLLYEDYDFVLEGFIKQFKIKA